MFLYITATAHRSRVLLLPVFPWQMLLKSWQPLTQNSASILIDTATQVPTIYQEYDISLVYIKLQPFCVPFCQSNVQQIFQIYCHCGKERTMGWTIL